MAKYLEIIDKESGRLNKGDTQSAADMSVIQVRDVAEVSWAGVSWRLARTRVYQVSITAISVPRCEGHVYEVQLLF